ncbi:Catechol 2,3-dioxygenase [Burkholderia sp. CF099]|jgi:catechol 2,3-dioxygenase-like lactoylglutathione lyase family enzyme|nr:Catechol 2,3-dioxygenase [Burkholderia sp. CF099]
MTILHLDHFTLRTSKVDETAQFFRDAIGLHEGWRPAFPFPGKWMYAGERPVVHIANISGNNAELEAYLGGRDTSSGGGSLDHISLRCQGLAEHQRKLVVFGLDFQERVVPELSEHQLFVNDPNGIKIELIFPFSPDNAVMGDNLGRLAINAS